MCDLGFSWLATPCMAGPFLMRVFSEPSVGLQVILYLFLGLHQQVLTPEAPLQSGEEQLVRGSEVAGLRDSWSGLHMPSFLMDKAGQLPLGFWGTCGGSSPLQPRTWRSPTAQPLPRRTVRLSSSSLVPLFLVGSKLGLDHQRARLCPQTKAELAMHLGILQKPEPRPLATTGCGSFCEAVRLGPVSPVTLPPHASHTPVPWLLLGTGDSQTRDLGN